METKTKYLVLIAGLILFLTISALFGYRSVAFVDPDRNSGISGLVVDSKGFEFAFDNLEYFVAFGGLFISIFLLFKVVTYKMK